MHLTVKQEAHEDPSLVVQPVSHADTSHRLEESHNNEPTYIQGVTGSIARFFVSTGNQETSASRAQSSYGMKSGFILSNVRRLLTDITPASRSVDQRIDVRRNGGRPDHAALVRHVLRNPNDWKARRKAKWMLRRMRHRDIERYTGKLRREINIYASLMDRPRSQSIHEYVTEYCYRRY